MEMQLRSWYSRQGLSHALSIYNFPEDFSNRPRLQTLALRFLFQYRDKARGSCPTIRQLCQTSEEWFDKFVRDGNRVSANEVADILGEFAPGHRNRLIDRLRQLEEDIEVDTPGFVAIVPPKPLKKTVYGDSQNVHNSKVNKSVLHAAKTLYNMYKTILEIKVPPDLSEGERNNKIGRYKDDCLREIRAEFITRYADKNELITESFKYIKTSVGTFGIGISLQDILMALWLWVQDQEHRHELETRLLEELKEMHGYCSTGHLARLINVMQGFTNNPDLCIRITDDDQYNAVIRQYLNKTLSECRDEEVIDGMIDGTSAFKSYVQDAIKKTLLAWLDEYGDEILLHIPVVVNDYIKVEVFTN